MIVKKNSPIQIDDTTDMIIRAIPADGEDVATHYFIVEMHTYTSPEKLHYKVTSHCLSIQEIRTILKLKKREVLSVL